MGRRKGIMTTTERTFPSVQDNKPSEDEPPARLPVWEQPQDHPNSLSEQGELEWEKGRLFMGLD